MQKIKERWVERLSEALLQRGKERGVSLPLLREKLILEKPPSKERGDLAFPLFTFAKDFREPPATIAKQVAAHLKNFPDGSVATEGPYINITFQRVSYSDELLSSIAQEGNSYGSTDLFKGEKIIIEFSGPNLNKPLHLGHLRINAMGETLSRLFLFNNANLRKLNIINDRGVHICKSMLAYQRWGEGATPESTGMKSDHLVGKFYVRYAKEEEKDPSLKKAIQEMLQQWENGHPEIRELWKKLNAWALKGIEETYRKTGVSFDHANFESQTYLRGKEIILQGLKSGLFYQDASGVILADMSQMKMDPKVLLRNDGTTVYITQDVGTAVERYEYFPFQRMIYITGAEQDYHFQALFHVLKQLGYPFSEGLEHKSVGMVSLPAGKMKSREGTVVDADDLLEEIERLAKKEICNRGRSEKVENLEAVCKKIALGALHYYLLANSPQKQMLFNPDDSLSFQGNTGPYLQYTGARIMSILRKYSSCFSPQETAKESSPGELLTEEAEWKLIKHLGTFPEAVAQASRECNPSTITSYLYELAKQFNGYYHDFVVLNQENRPLTEARLTLLRATLQVLKNGCYLLNVPFLEKM